VLSIRVAALLVTVARRGAVVRREESEEGRRLRAGIVETCLLGFLPENGLLSFNQMILWGGRAALG